MRFQAENIDKEITIENLFKVTNYSLSEIYALMGVDNSWGEREPTILRSKYPNLEISVKTECFEIYRAFNFETSVVRNQTFALNEGVEKRTGIGIKVFMQQVESLVGEGFSKIIVSAFGDCETIRFYNGFVTWGLFGFTMLEKDQKRFIKFAKNHGIADKTLESLLSTNKGRKFWEKNGFDWNGEFLLEDNSLNRQLLEKYLKRKGIL